MIDAKNLEAFFHGLDALEAFIGFPVAENNDRVFWLMKPEIGPVRAETPESRHSAVYQKNHHKRPGRKELIAQKGKDHIAGTSSFLYSAAHLGELPAVSEFQNAPVSRARTHRKNR